MTSYAELKKQIEMLTKEADRARKIEMADVIKQVKALVKQFNLSPADLGFSGGISSLPSPKRLSAKGKVRRSVAARPRSPVAPKYSDGNGNFWSGRGKQPKWLVTALAAGRSLDSFRISQPR